MSFFSCGCLLGISEATPKQSKAPPPFYPETNAPTVSEKGAGITLTKTGLFAANLREEERRSRCSGKQLVYWTPRRQHIF